MVKALEGHDKVRVLYEENQTLQKLWWMKAGLPLLWLSPKLCCQGLWSGIDLENIDCNAEVISPPSEEAFERSDDIVSSHWGNR